METLDSKIAALEIFNENSKKVAYYFSILQNWRYFICASNFLKLRKLAVYKKLAPKKATW